MARTLWAFNVVKAKDAGGKEMSHQRQHIRDFWLYQLSFHARLSREAKNMRISLIKVG